MALLFRAAPAARLSFAAAVAFLVLAGTLNLMEAGIVSSAWSAGGYPNPHHEWVMMAAFVSLGVSCLTCALAISPAVESTGGRLGLAVLVAVAAALTIAGLFTTDPLTATGRAFDAHARLRAVAAIVGIPGFPVAAILISGGLARNRRWRPAARSMRWAAVLTWGALALMLATLAAAVRQHDGAFGPDALIGWPGHLPLAAYAAFLMTVAFHTTRRA